jgi:gamma-glutamyl-gamma-aminobutyrate hydrolase PuuD
LPAKRFVLAVQWHPEDRIDISEADRKLFEAFASSAKGCIR